VLDGAELDGRNLKIKPSQGKKHEQHVTEVVTESFTDHKEFSPLRQENSTVSPARSEWSVSTMYQNHPQFDEEEEKEEKPSGFFIPGRSHAIWSGAITNSNGTVGFKAVIHGEQAAAIRFNFARYDKLAVVGEMQYQPRENSMCELQLLLCSEPRSLCTICECPKLGQSAWINFKRRMEQLNGALIIKTTDFTMYILSPLTSFARDVLRLTLEYFKKETLIGVIFRDHEEWKL
jgi:hypothetical protein